jgi:hypothetical protein
MNFEDLKSLELEIEFVIKFFLQIWEENTYILNKVESYYLI